MYIEQFVKYMNQTAKDIGMKDTNYSNPHGLDGSYRLEAYSNIDDQALLAKVVSSSVECSKIVGASSHTAELKSIFGKEV
jgi:D-alanyl-D-alanine carboxypeptidase (penicillin-binding protein 5/6)